MPLSPEQKAKLADTLTGTAMTMDQALQMLGMEGVDAMEAEEAVADLVFCCSTCGWWCDVEEENESSDGAVCNDCKESDE